MNKPLPSWGPAHPEDCAGTQYEDKLAMTELTSGSNETSNGDSPGAGGSSDDGVNGGYVVSQMKIPGYDEASKL